jgi:hypothetical protein
VWRDTKPAQDRLGLLVGLDVQECVRDAVAGQELAQPPCVG